MNIYVCVKHVPDSAATITVIDDQRIDEGITFLMDPYDEHALTAAVELKAQLGEGEIIAVCLANPRAEATLRSALAMGADRGILVCSDQAVDSLLTARALHAAINQDGNPFVILTGKESIDSQGMQTMFRLAGHFNMAAATNVVRISIEETAATVNTSR